MAPADDSFQVLPASGPFTIAVTELHANEHARLRLASFSQPHHGQLKRVGDQLRYLPGDSFWTLGSDSFTYTTVPGGQTATVVLTAAEHGAVERYEGFEDDTLPASEFTLFGPADSVGISAQGVLRGSKEVKLELATLSGDDGGVDDGSGHLDDDCGSGMVAIDSLGDIIDDGSVSMVQGGTETNRPAIELILELSATGRTISARMREENGVPRTTPPVALPDGPATLAWSWWAASEAGADDGGLLLRVDGRHAASLLDLSNHGIKVNRYRIGAIRPDPGLTGELFLDDITVRYGGLGVAFVPLLVDGLESGDLGRWAVAPAGGGLAVSRRAALSGKRGLEVDLGVGTVGAGAVDDSAAGARRYGLAFSLDPNGAWLDPAAGPVTLVAAAGDDGTSLPFTLSLRRTDFGSFQLAATTELNDGTTSTTAWVDLADAPQRVEVEWASAAGQSLVGWLRLWIDGAPVAELTGLANDSLSLSALHVGHLSGASGAGSVYLDDFVTWRGR